MTWVKVCGLTRRDDVTAAAAAGADAVGFVTWPGSPRRVTPEGAARLGRNVSVTRILVTVDATVEDVLAAAAAAEVDGVQPGGRHAAEAAAAARRAGYLVLRPIPVGDAPPDVTAVPGDQIPLLDTARGGVPGGTGRTFDWRLAAGIGRDVVIAGGLGPDNVAAAIARSRPWGVDASSRLEGAPGVKDHDLVARFVKEAKHA